MSSMLSPYRILDLTDERANLTGLLLAQLGAEVIAVEPPDGTHSRQVAPFLHDEPEPESSLTHWAWNRGKKSVVGGESEIKRLSVTADVIVDCGVFESLDLAALRATNPSLITIPISAFGSTDNTPESPQTRSADLLIGHLGSSVYFFRFLQA